MLLGRKPRAAFQSTILVFGVLLWALASCGGGGGVTPTNQAPVAQLNANPLNGAAPLVVSLDASGSNDPDGTIASYDWDLDGDGTYELTGGPAQPADQTFNTAGTYTIRVRVTDNGGLQAIATATITVTGGGGGGTWQVQTLDSAADVGEHCSMTIVDGRPAISYYDDTNGDLKYIRAADATGSAWILPIAVTGGDGFDNGEFTSLAIVDGNPAISYYDDDQSELRFIRADSTDGSTWGNAPVTVEVPALPVDGRTSLVVVNGFPAIAYSNNVPDVYYERADDAQGTAWSAASREIDGAGITGDTPSMAMVNGRPAAVFERDPGAPGILCYVRAGDADGTGPWQQPVQVHEDNTVANVGHWPSLAVVDGNPAISYEYYIAAPDADPYYVRANNADGGTGTWDAPVPTSLDPAAAIDGGWISSLAVVGGVPQVAFYNFTDQTLYHVRATDATGNAWLQPELVDDGGVGSNDVGEYCSLVDVGGQPAIAYYDDTANDLKYAVLQ